MVDEPERSNAERITRPRPVTDDEDEKELWQGGYSGKAMVGTWILAALLTVGAIVAAVMLPPPTEIAAVAASIFIWLLAVFKYVYHRLSVHYRLTNQRFFHQHGLLSRVTDRIEVIDMDDITFKQGPIERMMGVGSILITSSDRSTPRLWLHGLDNVQQVADMLDKARRAERRKRSVHIEQI